MSEPRWLDGDDFALNEDFQDLINCKECSAVYDRTEYQSDTCSDCEDKRVMREKESK
jgi:hypothetical protein